MDLLLRICMAPVVVLMLCWSFNIIAGMVYRNRYRDLQETYLNLLVTQAENSGKIIILLGFVYIALLVLGAMAANLVRWGVLGVMAIGAMVFIVRLGAASEFSLKKLPREFRYLMLPMLLPDIAGFAGYLFCGYWMIRMFILLGL